MKTHLFWVVILVGLCSPTKGVMGQRRDDERLYTAMQEIADVLRDLRGDLTQGMEKLLAELYQDRLARQDVTTTMRNHVDNNRRGIEMLRSEITRLNTRIGGGCPGIPHSAGGATAEGGSSPQQSVPQGPPGSSPGGRGTGQTENGTEAPPPVLECPSPYVLAGTSCLALLKERTPWEAARARCENLARTHGGSGGSGDLVVPHHMESFKSFIADADFDSTPNSRAWVGGSTDGWDQVWAWVDGSLMNELPWLYSADFVGQHGQLAVDVDGTFHIISRREQHWPICQLR